MIHILNQYRRFEAVFGKECSLDLAQMLMNRTPYIEAHFKQYPIFNKKWLEQGRFVSDIDGIAYRIDVDDESLHSDLMSMSPWRKGPFRFNDIRVDAEWDCEKKWARMKSELLGVEGKKVLEIGANNGYFTFKCSGLNPKIVVALEPHRHYFFQSLVLDRMHSGSNRCFLPIDLESFRPIASLFERIINCGVFYHQKAPYQALEKCAALLRDGGHMIFETLVTDSERDSLIPCGSYHDMPNVWLIPSVRSLNYWLFRAGFECIKTLDFSLTTHGEQSQTKWCPYPSFKEGIDPICSDVTLEGYPVCKRLLLVCRKKG